MELQAAASILVETDRIGSNVDVPTLILKDVRAQAARITLSRPVAAWPVEEVMVPDQRALVRPAESVEQKLTALLRGGAAAIPASHFRLTRACRRN